MRSAWFVSFSLLALASSCNRDRNTRTPTKSSATVNEPRDSGEAPANAAPANADRAIADALTRELGHKGFDLADVHVRSRNGIVELTGSVDSLLARERATRIAEIVYGVRAVSNRMTVEAPEVPDASLQADVKNRLRQDAATDAYEVVVTAEDGTVTLSGVVDSWHERDLAGNLAMSVRGVRGVENQLAVVEQPRSDAEIASDVRSLIDWDVAFHDSLINTEVDDGVVRLSGTVRSLAEKRRAEKKAHVAGAARVDVEGLKVVFEPNGHELCMTRYAKKTDEEIEEALAIAMRYDPRVDADKIGASSEDGTITLEGTVDNLASKMAAEQLARHTVGVTEVKNGIVVDSDERDAALEDLIEAGLAINPITDLAEISVAVRGGVVTLEGVVENPYERAEATAVAREYTGVREVDNQLAVQPVHGAYIYDPYLLPYHPDSHSPPDPGLSDLADEELERTIEAGLLWNATIDASDINVEVDGTTATLSGSVRSWFERDRVVAEAHESGAVMVIDELDVP